jgi:hypothetical protein
MVVRADGLVEPIPTISCCICRSGNNLYYDDIECYSHDVDGDGMIDQEPGTGGDEPDIKRITITKNPDEPLIREDNKRITNPPKKEDPESGMAGLGALFG